MRHLLFSLIFSLCLIPWVHAQERKLSGTVTDPQHNPLAGASVSLNGTALTTVTDEAGRFVIVSPSQAVTLTITLVGYARQEIAIEAGANSVAVTLDVEFESLDEVVVIGYGTTKRSDLTGAVSSIKAEEINIVPTSNVLEALAGKVAGIDVGPITRPGQSPSVLIRGRRSINAGNAPLYVVDGIPRNSIDDIPVSEVQSIDVLKDAVSASIYGARGANGVIQITTKGNQASRERTSIDFDTYYGINTIRLPDIMSGPDYIRFRRHKAHFEAYGGVGWHDGSPLNDDQSFDAMELAAVQQGVFTDWRNMLYNTTTNSHEHNLSIATSNANTSARFSVGYREDQGYYDNSAANRLSLGLKVDQRLFKFLELSVNSRYTNSITDDVEPGVMLGSGTVTYNTMTYLNPLIRSHDEDGNLIENVVNIYANPLLDFANPYTDRLTSHRLFSVFSLGVQPLAGLSFNSNFGVDLNNQLGDVFFSKNTTKRYLLKDSEGAYAEKNNRLHTDLTWDNILNYTRGFGRHNLNATTVFSVQQNSSRYFEASGSGLPDDALSNWNLRQLQHNIVNESDYNKMVITSFIGRLQYDYDGKYLFNASIRSDGTSVLAPGNKWATFPAASAGWVISNEDFYASDVLTSLKLRASYGTVGNAAINPYETYAGTKARRTNFGDAFVTGYMLDGLVNKSLGWEISKTTNLGVDWSILRGRVSGYVDLYRTHTTDLLFRRSLPHLSGSTEIWQNIGETSNRGVEVSVNSVNVYADNFQWETDFNFTWNRGRVDRLITDADMPDDNLFIGSPLSVYYNYILDGIWQVEEADQAREYGTFPGFQKRKDIAGPDGAGADGSISSVFDRVILGQRDPKHMLYLRNTFSYKQFGLTVSLNGKFGHMIQMGGTGWSSALPLDVLNDYWTPDNPSGKYPLLSLSSTNTLDGLWRYRTGDFIQVQDVSLSYRFSYRGLRQIGVNLQARNPFFLYKAANDVVDPTTTSSDWTTFKSFLLKLEVKF